MNAPRDLPSGVRLSDHTDTFGHFFLSRTVAVLGVLAFPRTLAQAEQNEKVSDSLGHLGQDLISWPVAAPHSGLSVHVVGGRDAFDPQAIYIVFGRQSVVESVRAAKAWMGWKHRGKVLRYLSWHILRDLAAQSGPTYLLLKARVLDPPPKTSQAG